jgi:hypothetical protein
MISLLKLDSNTIKGEKKRSVGSVLNVYLCYEFLCYSKNILKD